MVIHGQKALHAGKGENEQTWDMGDTFEFDITLEEVDGEWRVAGV